MGESKIENNNHSNISINALHFYRMRKPGQIAPAVGRVQTTGSVPTVDLHSAVVTGNLEAVRQHIKSRSDLNVLEPSRASTPLITAAALGNTEAAKILIDAGDR